MTEGWPGWDKRRTYNEHHMYPVSHLCRTEKIGSTVSLWNRAQICGAVLQHKKRPSGRSGAS